MDLTTQRYCALILLAQCNCSVVFDRAARNHVAFYGADSVSEVNNAGIEIGNTRIHFRQLLGAGYVVDDRRIPGRIRYGVGIAAILTAFLFNGICQSRVREYLFAFRLARIRDRPAAFIPGCYFQVVAAGDLFAKGIFRNQPVNRDVKSVVVAIPILTRQRDLAVLSRPILVVQRIIMDLARQSNTSIVIFALF